MNSQKRILFVGLTLLLISSLGVWHGWIQKRKSTRGPTPLQPPVQTAAPKSTSAPVDKSELTNEFDLLVEKRISKDRTLDLPIPSTPSYQVLPPTIPLPSDPGAEGRQKRKNLPMGLVLWDEVSVFNSSTGTKALYKMRTGDIVRIFLDSKGQPRFHIQPGVDVFLAATTRNIEAAGRQYPEKDGWVERDRVTLMRTAQAIEFTQETEPITLGNDSNFSTLDFYERAMKNPDPVVHRIVGPRLIQIISLHEDYVSSWTSIIRDPDSKIRSLALAAMKERGVVNSRPIVEDLITRLTELTQTRAVDEKENEVLAIIGILKDTHEPRVPAAFQSFKESWKGVQGQKILDSLEPN